MPIKEIDEGCLEQYEAVRGFVLYSEEKLAEWWKDIDSSGQDVILTALQYIVEYGDNDGHHKTRERIATTLVARLST
ncbi:hypothetical protein KKE34_04415 [Patescibacteria group bacterium]|nr:hypothetical protein [Patescibacteria group bacterium]